MTFFEAQKKLVKIWFVWISLLMIFVSYHVLIGKYRYVGNEIMEFVKLYIVPIFTLMFVSTFFSKKYFEEIIKDSIYFKLAYNGILLYLLIITILFCYVFFKRNTTYEVFIEAFKNSKLLFNFYEPIMIALLGYFFYNNVKKEKNIFLKLVKYILNNKNQGTNP